MAGGEGTNDNEAESRFGKVNKARLTDRETAHVAPSDPRSGQISPGLCTVSEKT